MVWIFSWGFLTATPTRIFEGVDVGCPEIKTCTSDVVERPSFGAGDCGDLFNEIVVECSTQEDWLGERCRIAE